MGRRKSYISGHCAGNARGGHGRCKWQVTDKLFCRCRCHDGLRERYAATTTSTDDVEETEEDSAVTEQVDELVDAS